MILENNENKEVTVLFYCVHWNNDWYVSAVGDTAEVNITPGLLDTSRPLSMRPRVCGAGGNNPCGGWLRPAPCHESRPNIINIKTRFNPISDTGHSRFNPISDTASDININSRLMGKKECKENKKNKKGKGQGEKRRKKAESQFVKLYEGTHAMRGPVGWLSTIPVPLCTLNVTRPPPPSPTLALWALGTMNKPMRP